jgi:hypothetical protein
MMSYIISSRIQIVFTHTNFVQDFTIQIALKLKVAMCTNVTSQKFQNKTNEFRYFQILEPTKNLIELSLRHSDLA